jgi:hypothetical protein
MLLRERRIGGRRDGFTGGSDRSGAAARDGVLACWLCGAGASGSSAPSAGTTPMRTRADRRRRPRLEEIECVRSRSFGGVWKRSNGSLAAVETAAGEDEEASKG